MKNTYEIVHPKTSETLLVQMSKEEFESASDEAYISVVDGSKKSRKFIKKYLKSNNIKSKKGG